MKVGMICVIRAYIPVNRGVAYGTFKKELSTFDSDG